MPHLEWNMPLTQLAVYIPVCCGAGTHYTFYSQWPVSTIVSYQASCAYCWLTRVCSYLGRLLSKEASPVLCEHFCHHVHSIPSRNRNPGLKVNERRHACVKLSCFCPCFETAYIKRSVAPSLSYSVWSVMSEIFFLPSLLGCHLWPRVTGPWEDVFCSKEPQKGAG